ncbi:S24 family peptidase [Rahnella sp. PCH160]|uniref:S24 family peptidase n=1 Tax=Rahnella sp. PCH160 TaxID=3447928 RepID=UPI0039FC1BF3
MTPNSSVQVAPNINMVTNFPSDSQGRLIATMPDDTMDGEIECRATIIIDNQPRKYLEDGIFAFFADGIFMVKRLQFLPDGILVLPNNKHYLDWKIEPSGDCNLVIIGRVVLSLSERKH